MGIRFYCPNGHRLNVKSFLAGKRGICPHCDSRFEIPFESQIPVGAPKLRPANAEEVLQTASSKSSSEPAAATATSTEQQGPPELDEPAAADSFATDDVFTEPVENEEPSPDPIAEAPDAVWYVRPPSGGQYGPARGDVMRKWIDEGRVSADSLVWREGWADWQDATVFPSLQPKPTPAPTPAASDAGGSAGTADSKKADAAPSFLASAGATDLTDGVPAANSSASTAASRARAGRKRSIAPLIVLGVLIVVLLVVTVIVVQQS